MELDKVMDAYNAAFEAAKSQKEQDEVSARFEREIEAAFEADEKRIEQIFEEEQAELAAQKKADADALAALEAQVDKETGDNSGDEKDEFDPKAGEPMKSDVEQLTQTEFKKKYKVKDIRVLADAIGVETRVNNKYKLESVLVDDIYKALS